MGFFPCNYYIYNIFNIILYLYEIFPLFNFKLYIMGFFILWGFLFYQIYKNYILIQYIYLLEFIY